MSSSENEVGTGRAGTDEKRWGVELRYACELGALAPALRPCFVPSALDTEGEAFLSATLSRAHGRWSLRAYRVLRLLMSDFDANALLRMYPVFLLSTPQALALLEVGQLPGWSEERLLDIGAGSGDITTRLTPLVEAVDCTETSRLMARRLRQRGLACWVGRVGENAARDPLLRSPRYGIISVLNVLDRTPRPRALLRAVVAHLPVGGTLLVSLPLPYDPFFYAGAASRAPEEPLRVEAQGWEEAVTQLCQRELEPLGLAVTALTRAPYLSGGDADYPAYVLDSVVLALKKVG